MMFEELVEFIGSQDGAAPKAIDPSAPPPSEIIGAMVPRVDGPLKTTGTARYASDFNFPGMVYAVPVRATVDPEQPENSKDASSIYCYESSTRR